MSPPKLIIFIQEVTVGAVRHLVLCVTRIIDYRVESKQSHLVEAHSDNIGERN